MATKSFDDATVHLLLDRHYRSEPPTPVYCFAIGRNKRGEHVRIPMQPQADGSLVSASVGERCEAVAVAIGNVLVPFRWLR